MSVALIWAFAQSSVEVVERTDDELVRKGFTLHEVLGCSLAEIREGIQQQFLELVEIRRVCNEASIVFKQLRYSLSTIVESVAAAWKIITVRKR